VSAGLANAAESGDLAVTNLRIAIGICSNSSFGPLAGSIRNVGRGAVSPAMRSLNGIPVLPGPQRPNQAGVAVTQLRDAAAKVLDLLKELAGLNDELAKAEAEFSDLLALADQQQNLADQADLEAGDMSAEEMADWLEEQEAIAAQLEEDPAAAADAAAKKAALDAMAEAMQKMQDAMAAKSKPPPQTKAAPKSPDESAPSENSKGKGGKPGITKPAEDGAPSSPPAPSPAPSPSPPSPSAPMPPMPAAPPAAQAQASAAESATAAAAALTDMSIKGQAMPSSAPPKIGKGLGVGGSKLMPGGPFSYSPMTFDSGEPNGDWAKIKGQAESGASADDLKQVAPEYRALVHQYFVELAREGGKKKE
jgi:hypothetical protein